MRPKNSQFILAWCGWCSCLQSFEHLFFSGSLSGVPLAVLSVDTLIICRSIRRHCLWSNAMAKQTFMPVDTGVPDRLNFGILSLWAYCLDKQRNRYGKAVIKLSCDEFDGMDTHFGRWHKHVQQLFICQARQPLATQRLFVTTSEFYSLPILSKFSESRIVITKQKHH